MLITELIFWKIYTHIHIQYIYRKSLENFLKIVNIIFQQQIKSDFEDAIVWILSNRFLVD